VDENKQLSINYSKTKSMLIFPKGKKSEFLVKIGKNKIEIVKEIIYLGIIFDEK